MPLTIAQRRERLSMREKQLQAAVDLRAQGKTWAEIAETIKVNSHQRAIQIHNQAVEMGIKAQLTAKPKGE